MKPDVSASAPGAPRMSASWLAAGGLGLIAIGGLLAAGAPTAADIPAQIAAPGKVEIARLHAEGVQIYECVAGPAGLAWRFREPLATLLQDGKTVGRHFAGPSWELSGDVVVGRVEAQSPGPTAGDIAQLKLAVVRRSGEGLLAQATTIQRLETHGGVFSGICGEPGALHLQPYAAEYVFLRD